MGLLLLSVGAPADSVAGSLWIEDTELHWLLDDLTEGSHEGTDVGTPANAVAGSLWLESNALHYIDANGDERSCDCTQVAGELPADGHIIGSLWIDTSDDMLQFVGDDDYKYEVGCGCGPSIPNFSTQPNVSNSASGCPVGQIWTLSWALDSTPAWAALEVWRCTGQACSPLVFWKRLAIATTSTTDTIVGYGDDGAGASDQLYGSYLVRVVPDCSANGAGPFCRDSNQEDYDETLEACVV